MKQATGSLMALSRPGSESSGQCAISSTSPSVEPSRAIGLFVPEFGNPVLAALAEAMETHTARAGLSRREPRLRWIARYVFRPRLRVRGTTAPPSSAAPTS